MCASSRPSYLTAMDRRTLVRGLRLPQSLRGHIYAQTEEETAYLRNE